MGHNHGGHSILCTVSPISVDGTHVISLPEILTAADVCTAIPRTQDRLGLAAAFHEGSLV